MKHAYLIMAHNEPYILERLLKLLDYEDNDIFLHIDKKCNCLDSTEIKKWVKKSNLFFTKRMDIRWGSNSQINCSLMLLNEAINKDHYAYYHFISGVDLPLKTQEEIHEFFDKNQGKEFIYYVYHHEIDDYRIDRVKYYHIFSNNLRSESRLKKSLSGRSYSYSLKLQKLLKVDRTKEKKYMYGANWFDITDDLARYIISKRKEIERKYRYTFCADEIFLQTLIYGTKYYDNLYLKRDGSYESCMRYIDWKRGDPYTFRKEDYDELMNSNMLFARKFSTKVDKKIIDMIYNKVSKKTVQS